MARHWLVKTEPGTYSFADLTRDGVTTWDGVRNNAAALHLKSMAKGDPVLVYHSGDDKAVVGLAEVSKTAFPDKSDPAGRFVAVELKAGKAVAKPVTLAAMKANPALAKLEMIRQSRLSVSPVSAKEWTEILKMAG